MSFDFVKRVGIISFILLQPIVNNINGLSIDFLGVSIIGPFFYSFYFVFFFLWTIKKMESFIFSIVFAFYFILMMILGLLRFSDISDLMKLIQPFFIFVFIKHEYSNKWKELKKLTLPISISLLIYVGFILLSFLIGYQKLPGHYTGFVFAGNDLIVSLIIGVLFYETIGKSLKFHYASLAVGVVLTFSKGLFLLFPVYFFKYMKFSIRSILLVLPIVLMAGFYFLRGLFNMVFGVFFEKASSISDVFSVYSFDYVANIFTFGRYQFVLTNLALDKKNWYEFILGSGIEKVVLMASGKVGTEMDFFDAFNNYGVVGLVFLFLFYYIPVFRLKSLSRISKLFFVVVVVYSLIGGHFYNNPMSGTFYAVILGILTCQDFKNKTAHNEVKC